MRRVIPDIELSILLALSRRLPPVHGAGAIGNAIARWYLRKPRGAVVTEFRGATMRVHPGDSVAERSMLFLPRLYDRVEFDYLGRRLRPGDTFVDAGAHVGAYSVTAARLVGQSGRVIAIEAFEPTFRKLRSNIELNRLNNVTTVNVGLSDRRETRMLHVNPSNTGGNTFLPSGSNGVPIVCKPLLEVLTEADVRAVRCLKIDIEGFERRVLGAFFQNCPPGLKPAAIIIECNPKKQEEGGALSILESVDYRTVMASGLNRVLELRTADQR